jgi:hypothetical protein
MPSTPCASTASSSRYALPALSLKLQQLSLYYGTPLSADIWKTHYPPGGAWQRTALLQHVNGQGERLGASAATMEELQLVLEWLDRDNRIVLDGEDVVLV